MDLMSWHLDDVHHAETPRKSVDFIDLCDPTASEAITSGHFLFPKCFRDLCSFREALPSCLPCLSLEILEVQF